MNVLYRNPKRLGIGMIGAGLYVWDRNYQCEVLTRSVRALSCGLAIAIDYKFIWTPYNASEVNARVARRIVDCCKANEGLYIKFGQVLGSMQVAFPPEFQEPLSELQDQANTFSFETIANIISTELSPEDLSLLSDICPVPVASASVAQVHIATYDGKKVALKIQKPNIEVQNNYDLAVFRIILTCLEYIFEIPMVWSFNYVKQQLESELDFRVEANNARLCREELSRNRHLSHKTYVPVTYCASRKVIIAEWIDDAVKITDSDGLERLNINKRAVVKDATSLFAYQIFGTGDVHCDPHPGNLLIRVKPYSHKSLLEIVWDFVDWNRQRSTAHEVVLIDHGLYTHLSPALRQEYIQFWMSMIHEDVESMREICKKWGIEDAELFSNMTRMQKRGSIGAPSKKRSETSNLQKTTEELTPEQKKMRDEKRAEVQSRMKARMQRMLTDTSRFPVELTFVNRCVNYIRATNWSHGAPIDRVAVFAETAVRANAGDYGRDGEASLSSICALLYLQMSIGYRIMKHSVVSSYLSSSSTTK